MYLLPICLWLTNGQKWCCDARPDRGTHENWRAAQVILAIATEVLGKLLPTIAYLTPTYEPMVRALMVGCTALAVRVPSGSNSDEYRGARSLEDAA
jgi:hypothetical protein